MQNFYSRLVLTASSAALSAAFLVPGVASAQAMPAFGDLIKLPTDGNVETTIDSAVYYYGADGKRYVFPNEKTYKSWYPDYSTVKIVSLDQLQTITIGGNVTYRPGSRLVKITTDPKVYAVSKNGILRAIGSEAVAASLFGATWNKTQVDDLADPFFVNYKVGGDITVAGDYDRTRVSDGSPTINVDKLLTAAPAGYVDVRQNAGFNPMSVTVPKGTSVTWTALDESEPTVASDPHPTHTDIPGFVTTTLKMGQTYTFTFNAAGTWGYHNHKAPSEKGTVIVTP